MLASSLGERRLLILIHSKPVCGHKRELCGNDGVYTRVQETHIGKGEIAVIKPQTCQILFRLSHAVNGMQKKWKPVEITISVLSSTLFERPGRKRLQTVELQI